ncbi:MAG: shikimate kinase [Epsilonproteobacteria bacterium]|nr:shikimate kinase [Campylobacterota bacterium]
MRKNADNLVFIGFMGVGKGSLARELTKLTPNLYGLDTDDLIESFTNTKIKKIFATAGEAAFRALEQKTADWLAQNVQNAVISTGGGFYKVNNLHAIGTVIYLKADFEWIYRRITTAHNAKKKLKKRPLFQEYEKAKALYLSRQEGYEKAADIVIEMQSAPIEEIAQNLLERVGLPTGRDL